MAEAGAQTNDADIFSAKALLWGNDLKDEVFRRWSQGFVFSDFERTALVQFEGGPCAVLAPVQAFIVKNALFSEPAQHNLSSLTAEESQELLHQALCDILMLVSSNQRFTVLHLEAGPDSNQSNQASASHDSNNQSEDNSSTSQEEKSEPGESSCKKLRLDQEAFHSQLRCTKCADEASLKKCMKSSLPAFMGPSGVLLYLYSILITKGIEQIKNEVEDPGEPLIDGIHGHGSQSLINLLVTGKAVTNVWDNDKDVSGLKLQGVSRRACIGLLSLMEHLRYCEVGWYLKNPYYPIWLIGSETHLTVLFSTDRNLIINETVLSKARKVFRRFDPECNGFIATIMLGDLLASLELVSEKEYVDIMATKLDSEDLGIITENSFFEEFFAGEKIPQVPRSFKLYHYNGMARSCRDDKVQYSEGQAVIQDEIEVQLISDVSPIKLCLLTKWPTIEMKWTDNRIPSIS